MWHGGRNSASADAVLSSDWAQEVTLVCVPFSSSACESPHLMISSSPSTGLQRINFSFVFFTSS